MGIVVMIFASPLLVAVAFKFGSTEIFSIMLLGLVAGSTMSGGSPLKGVAMTVVGLLLGVVGTDVNTGTVRFTFGFLELQNRVDLVALALGLFAVAEFMRSVNRMQNVGSDTKLRFRDMLPNRAELKQSFFPMLRGTMIGTLFGAMPGTGPDTTTFIAYAVEQKISKAPERFGHGALEGIASPEAAAHAKTQVDFIPTMTLGIPGDAVMALILGALMIQGITPGPQMITDHADLFWGLIASFWIGNVLLLMLNMPLIGVWVKLLRIPYRYLFPPALFFIVVGAYSTNNSLFEINEVLLFGVLGVVFSALDFPVAPILLGYVLGPMVEQHFRRALLIANGDFLVFFRHPISAVFVTICLLLILTQAALAFRTSLRHRRRAIAESGA